jgi:hypothetical protein
MSLNKVHVTQERLRVNDYKPRHNLPMYMSQGNDENGDLIKSLREMIKSRKMLKWELCGVISLKKVSDLINSLNCFSEKMK